MLTQSEKVKKVARILKKKLSSLTPEEAVLTAWMIVEVLDETPSKIEVKPNE